MNNKKAMKRFKKQTNGMAGRAVSLILAAVMAGSLTACGSTAKGSEQAADSAQTTENAAAETSAEQTSYVVKDDTGLVIYNWTGAYATMENQPATIVLSMNAEGTINAVVVWGIAMDIPEGTDEENADQQEFVSSFQLEPVIFTTDDSITEDEVRQALAERSGDSTEEVELTTFTTKSGKTMYQLAGDMTCEYSEYVSEETKELFETLGKEWETQRAELDVVEPTAGGAEGITFQTVDYDGNAVDESVFQKAKITMVNIWGSSCSGCIQEMPELQALNDEMEDVQIITVIHDVHAGEDDMIEELHEITATRGMTLPVLLMNDQLEEIFPVVAEPTSYLVDENGNVVGKPYTGATTKELYAEWIEKTMETMN